MKPVRRVVLLAIAMVTALIPTAPFAVASTGDLFISEYIEGSSFNKAIEIYNGTGVPVDLSTYTLELYSNGSATVSQSLTLSGSLVDGDVFVAAHPSADPAILAAADVTSGTVINWNGDDAIVLRNGSAVVDSFGQVGVDPGSQWAGGGQDDTLRRGENVCAGDTDPSDLFDASIEWVVFPNNTLDGLGTHTANCDGTPPTCEGVTAIADVQGAGDVTPFAGTSVTIRGIVTADFGGELMVQENSSAPRSGIAVFSIGNSANRGDEVCVTGVASERFGQTQIGGNSNPNAAIDILSSGNELPAPAIVATGDIASGAATAEQWEAVLVRVEGVTVDNPDLGFGEWSVDDGSGPVRVDDKGFTYLPTVGDPLDFVQGPLNYTFSDYKIEPRDSADIGVPVEILINEVDADQTSTDNAEFVELYDGGVGSTDLSGSVLVFFNGNGDSSYAAFDLDGLATDADGYFVLCGDSANVANCDLDVTPNTNLIQNGADAVALYTGDGTDFPDGTPVTTSGLLDALVYDTSDADDAGLLALLDTGQPQVNEDAGAGGSALDSNQRCPNGSGGALNTETFAQFAPSPGAENVCRVLTPPLSCEATYTFTPIHDIQGSGASTPLAGAEVYVEGVVVGDFQASNTDGTDLAGFYVQEEDAEADADASTSEGVFVFDLLLNPGVPVEEGDLVRIRGTAGEFQDQTQVSVASGEVVVCAQDQGELVTPTTIEFPLAGGQADLERFEGMAVTTNRPMTVIEYFNLDRFGTVDVATERLEQPTDATSPGAAAAAVQEYNEARRIRLDDGSQDQNPYPVKLPDGQLDFDDAFGGGDTLGNIEGVLSWIRPYTGTTPDRYAIQLTSLPVFSDTNPRPPTSPDVGGTLQVSGFNVLNYFNGDGLGGGFPTSRGADDQAEFVKQTDKIVSAIAGMDAAVVGLIEIENDFADGTNSAIADLVEALNAATASGTYAYIDPGANVGSDEITVAIIYQPARVAPVGDVAVLDSASFVDPLDSGTDRNRPAMAQTFVDVSNGATFTAVVNHFKSKGSSCGVGDDDPQQGNCNLTRTVAAEVLVDWLNGDPTGSGDSDVLLVGDYNAYAQEDPIRVLEAAGYVDLFKAFQPDDVYTYVFDGLTGYLDYGLASSSLVDQVTGTAPWNINADEPDAFDYNEDFDDPLNLPLWYDPSAYRSSDHDPVIVGLDLNAPPSCGDAEPSIDSIWPPNHQMVDIEILGCTDADGDVITITIDSIFQDEPVNADDDGNTAPDGAGIGTSVAQVRAERSGEGDGRVYHIGFTATDAFGNKTTGEVTVEVRLSRKTPAVDGGPLYDSTIVP